MAEQQMTARAAKTAAKWGERTQKWKARALQSQADLEAMKAELETMRARLVIPEPAPVVVPEPEVIDHGDFEAVFRRAGFDNRGRKIES